MLFGKLMNNYFYGKAGKGDYRIEDMPANRFQLFRTTLGVRWGSMIGLNLLYLIIWIPAIVWTFINFQVVLNILQVAEGLVEDGAAAITEQIAAQGTQGAILGYVTIYLLGMIPCIGITGPFTAGISYVTRNWARDQHSFMLSDFWDAVKGNWKQALGISFISGVIPFIAYTGWSFYGQKMSSSMFFVLPLGLVMMMVLVWYLSLSLTYTMMVTYKLRFRDLLRNTILMTVARFPHAIGIKLAALAITIIAFVLAFFIPSIQMYVLLVWCLYYALFGFSFSRMLYSAFANAQCEKYMNTRIEGAQTNIGLRPENWDDTEYRPEDDE